MISPHCEVNTKAGRADTRGLIDQGVQSESWRSRAQAATGSPETLSRDAGEGGPTVCV